MSYELWNSLATTATFLVIAATALVALVQLRHARGNNQILAMDDLRKATTEPEFLDAQHFVVTDLRSALDDPAFRYQIIHLNARTGENRKIMAKAFMVGNFYAYLGLLVKRRLLDSDVALDFYGPAAVICWQNLLPVVAIMRRADPDRWTNFEYAVVLAQDLAKTRRDAYPRGVRRLDIPDVFLDADGAYGKAVTSLSPAK